MRQFEYLRLRAELLASVTDEILGHDVKSALVFLDRIEEAATLSEIQGWWQLHGSLFQKGIDELEILQTNAEGTDISNWFYADTKRTPAGTAFLEFQGAYQHTLLALCQRIQKESTAPFGKSIQVPVLTSKGLQSKLRDLDAAKASKEGGLPQTRLLDGHSVALYANLVMKMGTLLAFRDPQNVFVMRSDPLELGGGKDANFVKNSNASTLGLCQFGAARLDEAIAQETLLGGDCLASYCAVHLTDPEVVELISTSGFEPLRANVMLIWCSNRLEEKSQKIGFVFACGFPQPELMEGLLKNKDGVIEGKTELDQQQLKWHMVVNGVKEPKKLPLPSANDVASDRMRYPPTLQELLETRANLHNYMADLTLALEGMTPRESAYLIGTHRSQTKSDPWESHCPY